MPLRVRKVPPPPNPEEAPPAPRVVKPSYIPSRTFALALISLLGEACEAATLDKREELLEPGEVVVVEVLLPPTSNLFATGHRIRLDVSSSNFPRLERNPNTGEPIGRHTRMVKAEQTVHGGEIVLPVIPS